MNATEFKKVYGISKKTLEKMEDLGLVAHMKGGYKEYQEDEVLLNELPAEVVREYQDRELYSAEKKGKLTKEEWMKRLAEIEQSQGRHKEWVQPVSKVVEYIYNRNNDVKEYTLQRAQGRCELCGDGAPFYVEGKPFLECHHIQWLSKGGRDFPDNTAALCPNCHRKLHHLKDKDVLDAEIERLRKNISINEDNMI